MIELLKTPINFVTVLLEGEKSKGKLDKEIIRAKCEEVLNMESFKDRMPYLNELVDIILDSQKISVGDTSELVSEDVKPWLKNKKADIPWNFWKRYKSYLYEKDATFPINSIDDQTDKILDKMMDPRTTGSWDRRGMVVGHVQSGKTANFIGIINKAADAGYKLIVVLAGIHNTLRAQTQARIDEGFIGRPSKDLLNKKYGSKIGVGKFPFTESKSVKEPFTFTSAESEDGDFNAGIATKLGIPLDCGNPIILVIKKQKHVLENLINWLDKYADNDDGARLVKNIPLLVIDDEADNASVDTEKEVDQARTINRHVRTLLNLFQKRTYIGYTATPYANLFIPDEWSKDHINIIKEKEYKVGPDLFPKDFILNIPAPSNYIGAAKVFGYYDPVREEEFEGLSIIERVEDQNDTNIPQVINKNNKNDIPQGADDIPESLKEAVKVFILCSAARRVRGQQNKHHSMLVHVARYIIWINRIALILHEVLRDYTNLVRAKDEIFMEELRELWYSKFVPVTAEVIQNNDFINDSRIKPISWDDVRSELFPAIAKIEVKAVHGSIGAKQRKEMEIVYDNIGELHYDKYEHGYSVIAVGGDKMSRGLTLEGLSVSYFLRTTKLYDALMQMGRWFGYRPGYVDLCKLYTTNELIKWFRHVTVATEVMREDFDEMFRRSKAPKDFQLKVMTHHGQLQITGAGKLREFSRLKISFSGAVIETYQLGKEKGLLQNNYDAFLLLLNRLGTDYRNLGSRKNGDIIWAKVDTSHILQFLESYRSIQPGINTEKLKEYIHKQISKNRLREWSVVLSRNSNKTVNIRIPKIGSKPEEQSAPVEHAEVQIGNEYLKIGLPLRNDLDYRNDKKEFFLAKSAIMGRSDRYCDLNLEELKDRAERKAQERNEKAAINKEVIDEQREVEQKGLLMIYPLDFRSTENVPQIPIVGFGLCFPRLSKDEPVEFAVRGNANPDLGFEDLDEEE